MSWICNIFSHTFGKEQPHINAVVPIVRYQPKHLMVWCQEPSLLFNSLSCMHNLYSILIFYLWKSKHSFACSIYFFCFLLIFCIILSCEYYPILILTWSKRLYSSFLLQILYIYIYSLIIPFANQLCMHVDVCRIS